MINNITRILSPCYQYDAFIIIMYVQYLSVQQLTVFCRIGKELESVVFLFSLTWLISLWAGFFFKDKMCCSCKVSAFPPINPRRIIIKTGSCNTLVK